MNAISTLLLWSEFKAQKAMPFEDIIGTAMKSGHGVMEENQEVVRQMRLRAGMWTET